MMSDMFKDRDDSSHGRGLDGEHVPERVVATD
jgi:hypothetical protein